MGLNAFISIWICVLRKWNWFHRLRLILLLVWLGRGVILDLDFGWSVADCIFWKLGIVWIVTWFAFAFALIWWFFGWAGCWFISLGLCFGFRCVVGFAVGLGVWLLNCFWLFSWVDILALWDCWVLDMIGGVVLVGLGSWCCVVGWWFAECFPFRLLFSWLFWWVLHASFL